MSTRSGCIIAYQYAYVNRLFYIFYVYYLTILLVLIGT